MLIPECETRTKRLLIGGCRDGGDTGVRRPSPAPPCSPLRRLPALSHPYAWPPPPSPLLSGFPEGGLTDRGNGSVIPAIALVHHAVGSQGLRLLVAPSGLDFLTNLLFSLREGR